MCDTHKVVAYLKLNACANVFPSAFNSNVSYLDAHDTEHNIIFTMGLCVQARDTTLNALASGRVLWPIDPETAGYYVRNMLREGVKVVENGV